MKEEFIKSLLKYFENTYIRGLRGLSACLQEKKAFYFCNSMSYTFPDNTSITNEEIINIPQTIFNIETFKKDKKIYPYKEMGLSPALNVLKSYPNLRLNN